MTLLFSELTALNRAIMADANASSNRLSCA
jgi:hypothetical protein